MLGVPLRGRSDMQHLVNIHFTAPGLKSHLRGREAMLYFVFNPSVIAVLVAHDISRGEFVAQASNFSPEMGCSSASVGPYTLTCIGTCGVPSSVLDVPVRCGCNSVDLGSS